MDAKYIDFFKSKLDIYSVGNGKYEVEELTELPNKYCYRIFKRIFDFICALVGIVICAIPMFIIAIIIKVDSPGPVFFSQSRLGKNGKSFKIIKFRSMRLDAEKHGAQWAKRDDDRATKVGKFLRASRIDEIPQLFNILLGQMSIVGPRPERKIFYDEFEKYILGFDQRLVIIPGLTGFAQINGGYDLQPEEKIIFDVEYIKKRSIILDLRIIFSTVKVIFTHEGAR